MALSPPAPPPPLFADSSLNVTSLLVRLPHQQDEHDEEQQQQHPVDREKSLNAALQILEKEGAVILHDCVSPDSLQECRMAIEPVIHALLSAAASAAAAAAAASGATPSIPIAEAATTDADSIRTALKKEDDEDKDTEKQRIFSCFDEAKVLTAEARRSLGITRIAKIGTGKKNVHFDPYYSSPSSSAGKTQQLQQQRDPAAAAPAAGAGAAPSTASSSSTTFLHPHSAMEALAETAGIAAVIRAYCGEEVTLAETGLSITRPGGEGLEWHADGREGECTVIMSVEDIGGGKGRLGVVRKSHLMLDRDESEDFDGKLLDVVERAQAQAEEEGGREGGMVWYAYRKGQPIVFDARTVHAAEGSKGEGGGEGGKEGGGEYRVILWWIYNGHG